MPSISQGVLHGQSAASAHTCVAPQWAGSYPHVVQEVLRPASTGPAVTMLLRQNFHIVGPFEPALADTPVAHARVWATEASEVEVGIGPASGAELGEWQTLVRSTSVRWLGDVQPIVPATARLPRRIGVDV